MRWIINPSCFPLVKICFPRPPAIEGCHLTQLEVRGQVYSSHTLQHTYDSKMSPVIQVTSMTLMDTNR
jgi:hypothetical protein